MSKNKMFFFGDYQGTRRNTGGSALLRVPSAAERQGDLSGLGVDIFDPASGGDARGPAAVRGKQDSGRAPVRRRRRTCSSSIPLPNIDGTLRDQPNYVGSGTIRFNEDLANTRWDYYLSGQDAYLRPLQPGRLPDGLAGHLRRARGRARLRRGGAVRGRLPDAQPEHRGGFRSRRQRDAADRFPIRLVPLPASTSIRAAAMSNPATDAGIPGLNIDEFSRGMPAFLLNGYGPAATRATSSTSATRCSSRAATARCARTSGSSSSSTTGRSSRATTPSSSAPTSATR